MIKIIFEINEEAISETTLAKELKEEKEKGGAPFIRFIGGTILRGCVEKGKKEFTVKEEKLDDNSKKVYNNTIGMIYSLAAFSETDEPRNK